MENQQKEIFADPFRNAKISQTHFAMRKFTNPNSQCENFAMRNFAMPNAISQCQNRFRNANFKFRNANSNFAMRKFRNAKFRNAKYHFAMRILNLHYLFQFRNAKISQCEIQFRKPFRIAKFTLRNFQALSSFVINAEPPSIFGVLLF